MIRRMLYILFFSAFLAGCLAGLPSMENAGTSYRHGKDYASLEVIYKNMSRGMHRKEIERLLGEPDYSPTDGQYYYSSTRTVYSENQDRDVAVGLVVDYRDEKGTVTARLHEFRLGPIGE